jgi:hypothetical protein
VHAAGIVIAVLGCETAAGDFDVKEWCFGGLPPQQALRMSQSRHGYVIRMRGRDAIGSNGTVPAAAEFRLPISPPSIHTRARVSQLSHNPPLGTRACSIVRMCVTMT